MNSQNITLIFNNIDFCKEHLGKDVFLVPYYLGKKKGYEVTILYQRTSHNLDMPDTYKGVQLIAQNYRKSFKLFPYWQHLNYYLYLVKNAKSIDVLMRFHLSFQTEFISVLYKLINRKGKVYVKLDINPYDFDYIYSGINTSLKKRLHNLITSIFIKKVNIFSCETDIAYKKLSESKLPHFRFKDKLQLLRNGFDEELLQSLNINEKSFGEKENLIITVGKLGTTVKNTEMLLKALTKVDLSNWKVCLIGSVDPKIEEIILDFYRTNPEKKESVSFIGPIFDKKELWEFYNRAKVFVLTSNWESYGLVLNEAKRFKNYIVSTEVGAALDLIEGEKYGVTLPINDDLRLAEIFTEIITEQRNVNVYQAYDSSTLSWRYQIENFNL